MEKITPEQEAELRSLFAKMTTARAEKDEASRREDLAKERIREITAEAALPITDGASEYLNIGQSALRITRPKKGIPTVNPTKLRNRIDNDEVFLRVVTVDKVTLNVNEWERALEEEQVTLTQLQESLDAATKKQTITVARTEYKRS